MRITESKLRSFIREALSQDPEPDVQVESQPEARRKIFVLVGPPSVGKSTWIRRTFRDIDPYVVSRDDVVEEIANAYGWTYDDTFVAPPKDAQLGDTHEKYGEVVKSPAYMKWQPLSYSEVLRINNDIQSSHTERVAAAADSGLDIVVDMTNMLARSRQNALAAIKGREEEFTKVAVVFPFQGAEDVVKQVAAKRASDIKAKGGSKTIPPSAMDRMMSTFEPVTPAEGFDEVVEFDNRAALRSLVDG